MKIRDVCNDIRIDPDVLIAYLEGKHKDFFSRKRKFSNISEEQYEKILRTYVGVFTSSMTAYCHIVHRSKNDKPSIQEVIGFWATEGKNYEIIKRRNKLFVFCKEEEDE